MGKFTFLMDATWSKTMPLDKTMLVTPEMRGDALLAEKIGLYRIAIQNFIDDAARRQHYDSGATLATYVNSTVPKWAEEAKSFVLWRDSVWTYSLQELDRVREGERQQPSIDEFLAELPAFIV